MQWEYKIYRELPEEELNDIGAEGWEIVEASFDDDGGLVNVLARRGYGGRGGGRGGGGRGRGRRPRGARIGVMGGTSIDDTPGY